MKSFRRRAGLVVCCALLAGCGTAPGQHPASLSPTVSAAPSATVARSAVPASLGSPSPSLQPSVGPLPTTSAAAAPDLTRYAWFVFGFSTEGEGTEGPANPTGDTLIHFKAGTLAGNATSAVDLRQPAPHPPIVRGAVPFGEGPFGRYGIYAFTDPEGSQLHRVDLLSGRDLVILRDSRIIHRAVFDPAHNTYYLALLDPTRVSDLGIWRYRPSIDSAPELLERPTGLKDAGPGPWRRLFLAPRGEALVVVDCSLSPGVASFDCSARSIDPTTGALVQDFGPITEWVTGITSRWFVVHDRAFALDGSAVRDLPASCGAPTLTDVGGDDTLVFESSGPGCGRTPYEITALDLDTGAKQVIWSQQKFNTAYDPALVPFEEHVMLPAGYVLLAPMNMPDPPDSEPGLLLSVADHSIVRLPPWP